MSHRHTCRNDTTTPILTSDGRELTRIPSDLLEGTIALHRLLGSPANSNINGTYLPDVGGID